MRPIVVTVGPLAAASANAIALSQSLGGAGNLTLNGSLATSGVATMDTPRRVLITSAGNDSGLTWTLTGTDRSGMPQSETFAGSNAAAVYSALDYLTVTQIAGSGATGAAITAGTNGVASSQWARFDNWAPAPWAAQVTVVGTVNYTVEQSYDDPNSATNSVLPNAMLWAGVPGLAAAATGAQQGGMSNAPIFARITLASGTGSVRGTFVQNSVTPR